MSTEAQTQVSAAQLKEQLEGHKKSIEIWVSAFHNFPTEDNFNESIEQMRTYTAVWMNYQVTARKELQRKRDYERRDD